MAGTGKAPARPAPPVENAAPLPVEDTAAVPVVAPAAEPTEAAAVESVVAPEVPASEPAEAATSTPVEAAAPAPSPAVPAAKAGTADTSDTADTADEASAVGTDASDEGESAGDGSDAGAGRRRVVVVGAVALALAAFAIVAAVKPGTDIANEAWVDTAATSRVSADARHAVETLYTYKFDTVDEDFDNARAVLTDSMRTEFDKTAQVTRDAVVQTKTATTAQVSDIGVKLIDGDNAELVGSMVVSATNDGAAQGSAQGPLSVTMKKVGDTWLLSDIRDR
ncbi:hypothetical protein [Rhodococcus kronopolitis]|uniref:Mce-associated membrane protein n=1 Tax=Rhodococcus kronopolitis TaxID=1460226 RepID=A0ABV9FVN7_9NOCA